MVSRFYLKARMMRFRYTRCIQDEKSSSLKSISTSNREFAARKSISDNLASGTINEVSH